MFKVNYYFRIKSTRFKEIIDLLYELFPTIVKTDWYRGSYKDAFGKDVSVSGCLVNYYKLYRRDLASANLISKTFATDHLETVQITGNKKLFNKQSQLTIFVYL